MTAAAAAAAAPMHTPAAAAGDFKPTPLADWYSHAHMMGGAAAMRYDTTGSVSVTPVTSSSSSASSKHSGQTLAAPHTMGMNMGGGSGSGQYVSTALPTPPSTGHSPIQSLSHHLPHLLPPTSSVAYT